MQRLFPTKSLATGLMAVALDLLVGLIVTMPVTHIRPMVVLYVALIVIGCGMLLRERIFPPRVQVIAPLQADEIAPMQVLGAQLTHEPAFQLVG